MEVLGLILARGGSKGIPKKNIKPLNGKPMIAHVIEKGLSSKFISRIVVSTDDLEIKRISEKYGASVPFLRPKELARDNSPALLSIQHALKWLKENENYVPDVLVILQANSPLMRVEDIDRAIRKFLKGGADVVYTVCEVPHPPQWVQRLRGDVPTFYFGERKNIDYTRRQNVEKLYRSTAAITVTTPEYAMKPGARMCLPKKGQRTKVIVTDPLSSIDIDNMIDFYLAETILKKGLI